MSVYEDFDKSWLKAKTNVKVVDVGNRYYHLTFPDGETYVIMFVRKLNGKTGKK